MKAGYYSCGCRFVWNDNGTYTHYCHPDCSYDSMKPGRIGIKGYVYVGWEEDESICQ